MNQDEALAFINQTKAQLEAERKAQADLEQKLSNDCAETLTKIKESLVLLNEALRVPAPNWKLVIDWVERSKSQTYGITLERMSNRETLLVGHVIQGLQQIYFQDNHREMHVIDPSAENDSPASVDNVLRKSLALVLPEVL